MKRRKRRNYLKPTALAALGTLATSASGVTYFVDDSVGTSGNGTTWATAKMTIQEVLSLPQLAVEDEIRVGQGLYKPSSQSTSINLANRVKIRGGYAGYGNPGQFRIV